MYKNFIISIAMKATRPGTAMPTNEMHKSSKPVVLCAQKANDAVKDEK